jgi:pimeloyl-ACP methyl ester carboxylesterase
MSRGARLVVDGVGLEVASWPGAGDPILMLHEGLGSVSMWRDFPERLALATGRDVVAWSRRGYGQSDPPARPLDPDYMHAEAESLPAVMDALGIGRAHLFGHSDGASIALIAAAFRPERVASLVLEAPHVLVEQRTVDSIAAVRKVHQTTDLGIRLGRHHRDADRVFRAWSDIWLDRRFRDWNIEGLLARVTAPALLIQGLDDEYGTLDQLDRIERALPRTRRLDLARCGHSPHRDQPQAVLAAIVAFLAEPVPSSVR